ncbi:hypothetical protein V8E36_001577 [Tilletia maclaganii]
MRSCHFSICTLVVAMLRCHFLTFTLTVAMRRVPFWWSTLLRHFRRFVDFSHDSHHTTFYCAVTAQPVPLRAALSSTTLFWLISIITTFLTCN